MAVLTIGDLDDDLIRRLTERAALRGRLLEEEARAILAQELGKLSPAEAVALTERWRARTRGRGGTDSVQLIREGRDEDLM